MFVVRIRVSVAAFTLAMLGAGCEVPPAERAASAVRDGRRLAAAGSPAAAATRFREATVLAPRHAEAWARLAAAELAATQFADARASASRALALAPRSAWAHELRARAGIALGDDDSAMRDLARAIELDPARGRLWITGARWQLTAHRTERALEALRHAVEAMPGDATPCIMLARLLAAGLGDGAAATREARSEARTALERARGAKQLTPDERAQIVAIAARLDAADAPRYAVRAPAGPDPVLSRDSALNGALLARILGLRGASGSSGAMDVLGSGPDPRAVHGATDDSLYEGLHLSGGSRLDSVGGESIGLGSIGTSGSGTATIAAGARQRGEVSVVSLSTSGAVTSEAIARGARARMGRLRACYERTLASDPTVHGQLVVSLRIAPSGQTTPSIATSQVGGSVLHACVTTGLRSLSFPRAAEATDALLSLALVPLGSAP